MMGDPCQPERRFQPDELALGEQTSGGVAGYEQAVEGLAGLVIVPSYSSAVYAFREIQNHASKAGAEWGIAVEAHQAALARFNELAAARPAWDHDLAGARSRLGAAE